MVTVSTLVFSPVDNADIPLLLNALGLYDNPSRLAVKEEIIGRNKMELVLESTTGTLKSRKAVFMALANLANPALLGKSSGEKIQIEQWIDFACTVALGEVKATHNMEEHVFAPLHSELSSKTFIAGGMSPSMADWALFALLFNKIVQSMMMEGTSLLICICRKQ